LHHVIFYFLLITASAEKGKVAFSIIMLVHTFNCSPPPPCAVAFSWWGDCVPQWPG